MICKRCGIVYKHGAKFCPKCGGVLEQEDVVPNVQENVQYTAPMFTPNNIANNNTVQNQENEADGQKKVVVSNNRKKTIQMILAIGCTFLVTCLLCGSIYYFGLRKPASEKESVEMTENQTDTSNNSDNQSDTADASETGNKQTATPVSATEIPKEAVDIDITAIDTVNFPDVTLYFSVKDLEGRVIDTLDASQLSILEKNNGNGNWEKVGTPITYYGSHETGQKSVAFVMDISGSMYDSLGIECDAADALLNRMEQDGDYRVALTAFSDTQHDWLNYTSNFSDFHEYLYELGADGDTAFYDTLYDTLNHALYENGQKYILAFTDGEDNASYRDYSEILELSKSYKIPIYIITTLDEEDDYVYDINEIAEESGGNLYTIHSMDDLQKIYYEIFQLQKDQLSLTYQTSQVASWCDMKLQLETDTYEGETIESFYAEKPEQYYALPEIDSIVASSEREGMYDSSGQWCTYVAENVCDGDNRTSWTEGKKGNGIGEYLKVKLTNEAQVNGINISNGYYKSKELYYRNNRIKKVRLTFSDGSSKVYKLEDEFLTPCDIEFDQPVLTSSIKIEILSVYKSKKIKGKDGTVKKAYDDTCITELEVY